MLSLKEAGLVSIPEPFKKADSSAIIPKAIPAFKTKPTDMKNVYDLEYWICAYGGFQFHGLDYDQTHVWVASNSLL